MSLERRGRCTRKCVTKLYHVCVRQTERQSSRIVLMQIVAQIRIACVYHAPWTVINPSIGHRIMKRETFKIGSDGTAFPIVVVAPLFFFRTLFPHYYWRHYCLDQSLPISEFASEIYSRYAYTSGRLLTER